MSFGEAVAAVVVSAAVWLAPGQGQSLAVRGTDQAGASGPPDAWVWPLEPRPDVVRRFDPPDQPWLPGHRGVDLQAHAGQPVLAPAGGRISFSGSLAGRGVVVVTHPNGLRSTFEPVLDGVAHGQNVTRGQRIASVSGGVGHCPPATCLHWGVLRGRTYLDPLSLLDPRPVVLLPLP